MAGDLGQMVVRIVGDNSDLDKSIDKSRDNVASFGRDMEKVGKGLSVFVTAPLVGLGIAAVKSSADMEMLEASFTTMLGSAEKAANLMGSLKDMAARTPFETGDLADAAKTLLQFGVAQEKVLPTLQMLGDAAGGSSEKFKSMALVMGQVSSLGRLQGQDLLQLINAGFNPLNEIAKKTGESMEVLRDRMSKGGVSAKEVEEAFRSATGEGGMFFNGMNRASQTLTGLLSTLKDDFSTLGRSLVQDLLPFIKDTVKWLSGMAQSFSQLDPEMKKNVLVLAGIAAAAGPVILAVGKMISAISAIKTAMATLNVTATGLLGPLGIAVAAFTALVVAGNQLSGWLAKEDIKRASQDFESLRGSIEKTDESFDDFLKKAVEVEKQFLETGAIEHQVTLFQTIKTTNNEYLKTAKGAKEAIDDIVKSQGVSADKAVQILLLSSKLTDEMKNQVRLVAQRNALDAALNAMGAAAMEADKEVATEKAVTDAAAIEAWREKLRAIRDVINSEKTESQIIKEQIAYIETFWSEKFPGTIKERDEALAILKKRLDEISQAEQKAQEDNAASLLASVEEAIAGGQAAGDEARRKAAEDLKANIQSVLDFSKQAISEIQGIYNGFGQNQLDWISRISDQQVSALEKEKQATLEAAGLAEKTEQEKAQAKLDEAIATGDAIKIKEAQDALKKVQIEQQYADKVAAIRKEQAAKEYAVQLAMFNANKAMSLAQIAITTAEAVIKAAASAPWPLNLIPIGFATGLGVAQAAVVSGQVPPAPPALAEGGVVMPSPGGSLVRVAEAGQAEAVFPLDKLQDFMRTGKIGGQSLGADGDIHLTVAIDSEPILKKIFPATRNRQVLISAKAVV